MPYTYGVGIRVETFTDFYASFLAVRDCLCARTVDLAVKHYVVVPDKCSIYMERFLFTRGTGAFDVEVLTFNRLFQKFVRRDPGFLSAGGAVMLVRGIVDEVKKDFRVFKSSARLPGFAAKMYETISVAANAGLAPSDFVGKGGAAGLKLADIARVYTRFLAETENKFVDLAGRMRLLARDIAYDDLSCTHFYVAGFDRFTALERDVLAIFEDKAASYTFFDVESLTYAFGEMEFFEAAEISDRVKATAKRIRRGVIEGARFRDFCILAPPADYAPIERILTEFDIPFFIDRKLNLRDTELFRFLELCVSAAGRFRRQDMIALSKNYYSGIDKRAADIFEEYVLSRGVNYKGFLEEFAGDSGQWPVTNGDGSICQNDKWIRPHLSHLSESRIQSPESKTAENVRASLVGFLAEFAKLFASAKTGEAFRDFLRGVFTLCGAKEKTAELSEIAGADLGQIYDGLLEAAEFLTSVFRGQESVDRGQLSGVRGEVSEELGVRSEECRKNEELGIRSEECRKNEELGVRSEECRRDFWVRNQGVAADGEVTALPGDGYGDTERSEVSPQEVQKACLFESTSLSPRHLPPGTAVFSHNGSGLQRGLAALAGVSGQGSVVNDQLKEDGFVFPSPIPYSPSAVPHPSLLTPHSLFSLFSEGVGATGISLVNETADAVVVGGAETFRAGRFKEVFAVDFCEGVLPEAREAGGLFSDADNAVLSAAGKAAGPDSDALARAARCEAVRVLASADRLFLAYSLAGDSRISDLASAVTRGAKSVVHNSVEKTRRSLADGLSFRNAVEHNDAAKMNEMAAEISTLSNAAELLLGALSDMRAGGRGLPMTAELCKLVTSQQGDGGAMRASPLAENRSPAVTALPGDGEPLSGGPRRGDTSAQREVPPQEVQKACLFEPTPPSPRHLPPARQELPHNGSGSNCRAPTPTGNNMPNPSAIPHSSLLIPNFPRPESRPPSPEPRTPLLYFRDNTVSATRLEEYLACPYRCFAAGGLRLKERDTGEIRPTDIGSFLHRAAERFVEACFLDGFKDAENRMRAIAGSIAKEEFGALLEKNKRLLARAVDEAARLAGRIAESYTAGAFKPLGLELRFGHARGNDLKTVAFLGARGQESEELGVRSEECRKSEELGIRSEECRKNEELGVRSEERRRDSVAAALPGDGYGDTERSGVPPQEVQKACLFESTSPSPRHLPPARQEPPHNGSGLQRGLAPPTGDLATGGPARTSTPTGMNTPNLSTVPHSSLLIPNSPRPESRPSPVYLRGKIDRVDTFGGFARVIDYKTGKLPKFSATELYYGRALQLPLYAKVLEENGYQGAGMFYFPLSKPLIEAGEPPRSLCGVYNDSGELLAAADRRLIEPGYKSPVIEAKRNVKPGADGVIPMAKSEYGMGTGELGGLTEYAVRVAQQALEEMCGGYIAPSPAEGVCDYCSFGAMCGFGADGEGRVRKYAKVGREEIFSKED
ncbi:MAG: PD-(D/E)XK nuclease family protein [Firmicutes bacterium]|nr:PD-(D/E)XK nuclease family protein [Bacillota bacterium]